MPWRAELPGALARACGRHVAAGRIVGAAGRHGRPAAQLDDRGAATRDGARPRGRCTCAALSGGGGSGGRRGGRGHSLCTATCTTGFEPIGGRRRWPALLQHRGPPSPRRGSQLDGASRPPEGAPGRCAAGADRTRSARCATPDAFIIVSLWVGGTQVIAGMVRGGAPVRYPAGPPPVTVCLMARSGAQANNTFSATAFALRLTGSSTAQRLLVQTGVVAASAKVCRALPPTFPRLHLRTRGPRRRFQHPRQANGRCSAAAPPPVRRRASTTRSSRRSSRRRSPSS